MPSFTQPGVYVEEITGGPPPIAGVPTDIAAFVDTFAAGPLLEPQRVHSPADFDRQFGAASRSPARHALRDFFANGGRQAWVVRIPRAQALRRGLKTLADVESFNILCLPRAAGLADSSLRAVYGAALELCAARRAFLIIDIPAAVATTGTMRQWLEQHAELRHANAAVYFPRLLRTAPQPRTRGVSGAIAGLYARNDAARGVWKAATGSAAELRGIDGLASAPTDLDSDLLNPLGVNVLRHIDGLPVCWGARTLSADPEWIYIPVRRLALFIEASLERGLTWAAFEANAEPLWQRVRRSVEDFLTTLWQQGALAGAKPEQAFFVRADRSTMTESDIVDGRLILLVGFAPIKPAEFVVLQISIAQ